MCRSAVSKSRTCGICVKLRGLLKTHFRLVHGNKGSRLTVVVEDNSVKKTYVCKICDKKFAKNSLRNEHLLFSHGWDALDDGNKPLLDIDPTPFPYQATGDVVKKSEQNPDDRGGYFSTDNESNDANNESDVSVKRERKRRRRDRKKAGYPLKPLERITSIKVEPSDRNTNDPPHGKHKRRCSNSKRKKETYAYCENLGQKEDGKTYFKCSNCSYESHLKPNVKRHYDVVHLNVHRYRCTQCDVAYKGREALVRHLAREQCGGTFEASPKRRPRRGRRRNTIDTDPEELDACVEDESYEAAEKDSDATPKKDVNVAYYEDLGEGSKLRYKCIECDYMSSVKRSVKLHHEALHQNSGQYTCLLCSRSFGNKTAFESHLASKKDCNPIDSSTPEKAQYDCKFDGCNYTTRLNCNMKRHYKRQHSAEYKDMDVSTFCETVSEGDTVKYKCKSVGCDYISKYRPNVKRHFDRYHCTSDFECNFCRRKFPKKALLHSHILKHASKATDVQREVHNTQATANVASEPANAQADLDPSHAVPHYANKPVEMQQRSFETPTTTYANLTDKPIDIQRQFETPQALPSFGNKPASVQGAFEAPNIITAYPGKPPVIEQPQNYPHFPRHPMDLHRQFDPLQTMPGFPVKPIVTQQEFEASQTVPGFAKWENTVQPKAIGVTGVQDEYPVAGQPRAVQQPFETPQNGTNRIDRGSEDKSTNVVAETGSDKTQTCQLCSKSFATLDILAQHLNEHISEHSHLCEICAKSFLTKVQLTQHLRRHSYNLQCRFCPKMFNCKTSLKIHENTHTGEKPNSCEFCGKGFACRTNLLVHLRVHTGEKPYKCKLCEYTANQSQSVKKHMIASHGGERTFACHLCSRMFKFKSALTMHIRRHLGDKRHFCDICNMGFVAPNTLKEHKRTHSDVRAFKCTMCTQAFKRKDKLTHHIKSQHSKPEANPPSSLVNVSASISQMLNWHNYPPM